MRRITHTLRIWINLDIGPQYTFHRLGYLPAVIGMWPPARAVGSAADWTAVRVSPGMQRPVSAAMHMHDRTPRLVLLV